MPLLIDTGHAMLAGLRERNEDLHTLQQRMDAGGHFTVPSAVTLGIKLARALGALHRRSIIHATSS
jgi:hypothetical protein